MKKAKLGSGQDSQVSAVIYWFKSALTRSDFWITLLKIWLSVRSKSVYKAFGSKLCKALVYWLQPALTRSDFWRALVKIYFPKSYLNRFRSIYKVRPAQGSGITIKQF